MELSNANETSESWQQVSQASDEARRVILASLRARDARPHVVFPRHFSGRQHLAFAIVADQTKDLVTLEDLLGCIEDSDVEFGISCLELFGHLICEMPLTARMDLLSIASDRVARVINLLPDEQVQQQGDKICYALPFVVLPYSSMSTQLLERSSVWLSMTKYCCKEAYATNVQYYLLYVTDIVGMMAEVVEQLSQPALQFLQEFYLTLLHPDSALRRLWGRRHELVKDDALAIHAIFTAILLLQGPLVRWLSKHGAALVDSRTLAIMSHTFSHLATSGYDPLEELCWFDDILRSPPSRRTSKRDLKTCSGMIKLQNGLEPKSRPFSRHMADVICGACGRVEKGTSSLQKCSGCGVLRYCCLDCQKNHWTIHKLHCKTLRALRVACK